MGLLFARQFAKVALIPNALLAPIIVVLSFTGSLALRRRFEDVVVTFIFGIIWLSFSSSMTILRLAWCLDWFWGIRWRPISSDRCLISGGDYSIFFTRPISLALLILTMGLLVAPYLKRKRYQ